MIINEKRKSVAVIDPGGHLCDVKLKSLKKVGGQPVPKAGWRFATAAEIAAKAKAEADRVAMAKG